MNQDSGYAGAPRTADQRSRRNGGESGGGSVRRAREMAESGRSTDRPSRPVETEPIPIMIPQPVAARPNDRPRQTNTGRRQGPLPAALSNARTNPATVGQVISKPAPMAQWPLQEDSVSKSKPKSAFDDRNAGKGPTPQRPPRPSHVPSLLDSSKIREYTPSMPYNQQQAGRPQKPTQQDQVPRYWEDNSTSSIPDFPVPAAIPSIPLLVQRKGGPPPTTRRGPSSHYSTISHVSPIIEERDSRRTTGSFASSHVIPSSWGSNSPDDDYDYEGRNSRDYGHDEGVGLVRQASLGQRHKPALRTIKSSEDTSLPFPGVPKFNNENIAKGGMVAQAAVAAGAGAGAIAAGFGASRYDMPPVKTVPAAGPRTVFLDASSSSSSPLSGEIDSEKPPISRSPATPPVNPRIAQLVGGLEKGKDSLGATPAMSDIIPTTRRPPRLNLDAVKDAEARGSLTSLPDLIKRATRLASNLDRGKTASRVGMLDLFKAEMGGSVKGMSPDDERPRSGSISDILASFPPPGLATPTGERPTSRWPSPFPNSPSRLVYHHTPPDSPTTANRSDVQKNPRRKCCGMPLWAFILVCLILILLVAAAVVVPVTLIVLPRQQQANKTDDITSCSASLTCSNGGTSVLSGKSCRCVCVNGFTGDQCTVSGDIGCTTMDISNGTSTLRNVTIGGSIPRLLLDSQANYSIPLNSSAILSLFSSNNLSCSSENALVTFNGNAQKRSIPLLEETETEANRVFSDPKPTPTGVIHDLLGRQDSPATTSNGIVFQATSTPGAAAATASPSSTSTSTSSSNSNTAEAVFVDAQTTDFARIVILFILQQTGNLTSAVLSQERIQGFFQNMAPNATMSGNDSSLDFTINFGNFSIALTNGTTVGGRGPSPSATPTAPASAKLR